MEDAMSARLASGDFDFAALRHALEHSDPDSLLGLYADDAEMMIVDRNQPPSTPFALTGKAAIEAFWRDVCSRDMTHRVGNDVVGPDRVSFIEHCEYPDGCRVMSAMFLDLEDARIKRHVTVQAWDEVSCSPATQDTGEEDRPGQLPRETD
jgi:hypothetical protein